MVENSSAFDRLRALAEDMLSSQRDRTQPNMQLTDIEFKEVLHELQVYQIELEIQNEELRQAQDKLATSRHEFSELFEHAPVAYFTVDGDGAIVRANSTAAQKFGRSQDEMQGMAFIHLVTPDERDSFYLHRRRLLKTREAQTGEFTFIRPDNSQFFGQLESVLVDAASTDNTFRTAVMDITQIKQAEVALQQSLRQKQDLNALKTRLIEVISHELRTPLSTMLTSIYLLENHSEGMKEEKRSQLYKRIRAGAWYLRDMVHDVVVAHRSGNDTPEVKTETFDAVSFVQQLTDDLGTIMDHPERLHFSVQNGQEPETVTWDKQLVRRIITNLIQNAIKYSETDVTCTLTCERNMITIQIEDQGPGIQEVDQAHVFEMFYRGNNALSIPGTGVGLAVVKSAVEVQHGTIRVTTDENGTTFAVCLPRIVLS